MLIAPKNFDVLVLLCNLLNAHFCIIKIQIIIVFKHINLKMHVYQLIYYPILFMHKNQV